jgi:ribonuclease HII|tara:strand:+ start:3853 stop:4659 length:807 start_codon:yes stop_codon:yes gene_type:complete
MTNWKKSEIVYEIMKTLEPPLVNVSEGWIIGIDEAGRGPVIGPLVVTALAVPENDVELLKEMGVRDSKELSTAARDRIAIAIQGMIGERGWKVASIICSPRRIDLNKLDSDLNSLEIKLFSEAVTSTNLETETGIIRADACDVNESRFANRLVTTLGAKWSEWTIEAEHGMDSKDLVAGGASVIAKVNRDLAISEIAVRTGIEIGSGYPSDQKTRNAVKKLLDSDLPHDCLRWSWATVSDIWTQLHGTPVPIRSRSGGSIVQSSLEDW